MYTIKYAVDVAGDLDIFVHSMGLLYSTALRKQKALPAAASRAFVGSSGAHGRPRKVIPRALGAGGFLEAAATRGLHAAAIDRRAAATMSAVMKKVVQPAMTATTARIAGIAAGRLGRAAGGFGHAASRLGSAAGRLAAAGHVATAAEGLGVLAEARDRTRDQQQRKQNLGFHSGGSPKGSRMFARLPAARLVSRLQRCVLLHPSSKPCRLREPGRLRSVFAECD